MQLSLNHILCATACVLHCVSVNVGGLLLGQNAMQSATLGRTDPAFMLVSGITAPQEMCLTLVNGNGGADGAIITLESCAAALAAGDGRELWAFQTNGQLVNVVGNKCIGLQGEAAVGSVGLVDCDSAAKGGARRSQWEAQANGQLKLGADGDLCLSQVGSAPGMENVAANAAVVASSTVDAQAHGAKMAVDDNEASFWASKFDDTKGPVTFTVDLGEPHKLQYAELSWEFPAKSFAVSVSTDGEHFREIFSTDVNVLKTTFVQMGSLPATQVKVVMREPHAVHGRFQDSAVYGIKSLALYAPRLQAVVDRCAIAAKCADARDKYFLAHVGEFDPSPAKALRSELPRLEAAKASLTTAISDLADVMPQLASCQMQGSLITAPALRSIVSTAMPKFGNNASFTLRQHMGIDSTFKKTAHAVEALMAEARSTILTVHKALN